MSESRDPKKVCGNCAFFNARYSICECFTENGKPVEVEASDAACEEFTHPYDLLDEYERFELLAQVSRKLMAGYRKLKDAGLMNDEDYEDLRDQLAALGVSLDDEDD